MRSMAPVNRGDSEADTLFVNKLEDEESPGFPRPFCLVAEPGTRERRARIAPIGSELGRRVQADRCGACAVAHGDQCAAHCDGCVVLAAVAFRVFRWRREWRAWREWRARPVLRSVLQPLTAPLLPIA